ncbi:MAG: ComF family protein [Candidatus Hydrogenedentes bacterium]|nr:ComF family protein [Candidatus Hydrogenedentota bacterium]
MGLNTLTDAPDDLAGKGARRAEQLRAWTLAAKNIFLPIFCQACRARLHTEENGYFCPDCWESAARIEAPFCSVCGVPHESMVGYGSRENFPCSVCRATPPPHVDRIVGVMVYAEVMEQAIKLFKFHGKSRLAGPLGLSMRTALEESFDARTVDVVIPVPLHPVRQRGRGYNQSALLAQALMPAAAQARYSEGLKRIRPTRTQSRLRGIERRDNMRGAFAVADGDVTGKFVLLVDDVVTTGGTVIECAAALKAAGAARVEVFALALAVPKVRARVI